MSLFLKLGLLGIRAATKWVSKSVKQRAATHPTFRQKCISTAETYHEWSSWVNVRLLGGNIKFVRAKPLTETEAVNQGSELLAEAMIWGAAAFQIIFLQYWQTTSSSRDKEQKEQQLDEKFQAINNQILQLTNENIQLDAKISTLIQILETKEFENVMKDNIEQLTEYRLRLQQLKNLKQQVENEAAKLHMDQSAIDATAAISTQ